MQKKWFIALVGTLIHLCLGTVYAWSFFQTPIAEMAGWTNSQVVWAFSLSIFMLGITAGWGGIKLPQFGPRKLAMIGGILYALGYVISSYALSTLSLPLLYIGFGVIGGIGLGLAYVTPVATVSKWFTKHQGVATGMVVMGFGFGALLMSKLLAPMLLQATAGSLPRTFLYIGIILAIVLPLASYFLVMPNAHPQQQSTAESANIGFKVSVPSSFYLLWVMFLINVTAGMVFISFQSPLLQDLIKQTMPTGTDFSSAEVIASLSAAGASLIAVSSIFNGAGRFVWASISDKIGRLRTLQILLGLQAVIFFALLFVKQPFLFSVFVCVVLLCYGGGFGVLPSLVRDAYGSKMMAIIYGFSLTAWGAGGLIGPKLVAFMKDNYPEQAGFYAFVISGVLLIIGLIISFWFKPKAVQQH